MNEQVVLQNPLVTDEVVPESGRDWVSGRFFSAPLDHWRLAYEGVCSQKVLFKKWTLKKKLIEPIISTNFCDENDHYLHSQTLTCFFSAF